MNSFHFVQTWKQSFRRNSISPIEQAKRFWDNSDSLIQDKDPLSPWSQLTRLMRGQDLSNKKDGKFFTKRAESISSKDKWQNILMNEKRKYWICILGDWWSTDCLRKQVNPQPIEKSFCIEHSPARNFASSRWTSSTWWWPWGWWGPPPKAIPTSDVQKICYWINTDHIKNLL